METVIAQVVAAAVLLGLWVTATRRHVRRRRIRSADWEEASARPDLWTSAARCPRCGAGAGLLELEGDQLWYECLSCRKRHVRQTRG